MTALGAFRRGAQGVIDFPSAARAARELLGVSVEATLRGASDRVKPAPGGVAVVLAEAGDESPERAVVVEMEPALAASLVSRAMKRPAPRVLDPAKPATEPIAGAAGAVLVAIARRAGTPVRLMAAGSSEAILASHLGGRRVAAAFTVLVEYDAFVAHVVLSASRVELAAGAAFDVDALARLGDVKLALPVVAAWSRAAVADVAALRPGDAWLPRSWSIRKTPHGFSGTVGLVAARAERGLHADLGEDGRLVLRQGEVAPGVSTDARSEGEMVDKDALLESVGEVPVVVRVEVGAVEMSAREWAALGPGDVVALGRRVGELVVLRVGGIEVARGELVEIEGELGVRVTHRTGSA